MSNFARALRIALSHRVNVVACLITSLVVAVLWAGNLSAVFWIVDVVMNDKSVPEWMEEQVSDSQQQIVASKATIAKLSANPEENRTALGREEFKLHAQQTRHNTYSRLLPMAVKWLPTTAFQTLVFVCGAVMLSTLLKNAVRVLNQISIARLGHRVGLELRKKFYQHLLRLDMSAYSHQGRGDLMNRCTTDLNYVCMGVQTLFGMAVREPLKMLACFCGAAYVSWRLLLLTVLVAPPAAFLIRLLAKSLKRANRRAMEELSNIYETLTETLSGMKLIKAFTMEDKERERFDKSAYVYYRRQMKIATYNSLVSPTTENLGIAMVLTAALAGGYLVLGGKTHLFGLPISNQGLTHGDMAMFFSMLAGMSDPARRLSNVFNELQQSSAASDRVYQVLDTEPKIKDPVEPKPLPRLSQASDSRISVSAITPTSPCYKTSTWKLPRAKPSPLSAPTVAARPPSYR